MSGPVIVVIAGFFTLYLAISGADGLVVDDYYKEGKAINQALHRDDIARQAGLQARVTFDQTIDRVEVAVRAASGKALPDSLRLTLVHATRGGFDHIVPLVGNNGAYVGTAPPLRVGKWNVLLEDPEKQWRLQQEINVGTEALAPITLSPPKLSGNLSALD
jgi:hypothetical protein